MAADPFARKQHGVCVQTSLSQGDVKVLPAELYYRGNIRSFTPGGKISIVYPDGSLCICR